jgi:hypothetical protein
MTKTQNKTPEQMVEAVFALDLDPIKFKLMDKKEGEGWSRVEADYHELEYRRYLALLAKYPDEVIAPDSSVDTFWHAHILDTMKYAQDCDTVFGYFLHHFPYFGLRDAEDAANLASAADNMRRLHEQEFGTAAVRESSYCARATAAYCAKAAVDVATTSTTDTEDASYCAKAAASYCARVVEASAYCAKAPAYCAKAAVQPTGMLSHDVVTAKGRPALASA